MAGSDEARSLSAAFPAPRLRSTRPELFSPLDNGPDFDQLTGYELMARKPPGSLAARFPSSEGSIMANIWMLVTIMFGVFFYALRCRQRLWYGLIELAVAFIIIFLTFHPPGPIVLAVDEPTWWGTLLTRCAGSLAGVYFIVRALDNIEKGLPSQMRRGWDRLFHGKVL